MTDKPDLRASDSGIPDSRPPDSRPPDLWIVVARILRPQGRKGEVLAELLTDFPESLSTDRELFLATRDRAPTSLQPIRVTGHWLPHGRNQGRIVLAIAGVDSIAAAERLSQHDLIVREEARTSLSGGTIYISDLVGLRLLSGGKVVGAVEDVSFPLTADGKRRLPDAAPLLVVQSPADEEILVPFVQAFLSRIDRKEGVIEMSLPEGLIDLNLDGEG